ncbi:MAG: DNA-protecting protein DprA, partial [Acidobacteriota bacterium]|nr:DNA-protecting protein DprA [Acidobacteriota bacterium]
GGGRPEEPDEAGCLLRRMDPGESYDLDELAGLSGLNHSALATHVLELELAGRITRLDGGRFSRS